jgi:murein DD-endopeptidase MepM/ murein hydrolase activator NlpD
MARRIACVSCSLLLACTAADGDDLVPADESIVAAQSITSSIPVGTSLRTTEPLNLRTGAGTTYRVLSVIPAGTTVTVVTSSPSNGYYNVRHAGVAGWSHGGYLERTAAARGAMNLLPWTAEKGFTVSQAHNGGSHTGNGAWAWDFGMPVGTPLRAAHFGTVRLVKGDSSSGGCSSTYANAANYVIVDQGNGYESLYLHLSSVSVSVGQRVERGTLVGYSGQTGWSCGAHLHFQIQRSPSNGGTGWYNPTIHDYFYDTGSAWDPPAGAWAVSKNAIGTNVAPLVASGSTVTNAQIDFHGNSTDWDAIMQSVSRP